MNLLLEEDNEYYMFCDQDDFWKPHKVETTLNKMLELESQFGKEMPLLVHSNLEIVDENLNTIAAKMYKLDILESYNYSAFEHLLVQNHITGCTIMINKKVKELTFIPKGYVEMHDWWVSIVASAFGKIGYIDEPLMKYRQHSFNVVGAKRHSYLDNIIKVKEFANRKTVEYEKALKQVATFGDNYKNQLTVEQNEFIEAILSMPKSSLYKKVKLLNKYQFSRSIMAESLRFKLYLLIK